MKKNYITPRLKELEYKAVNLLVGSYNPNNRTSLSRIKLSDEWSDEEMNEDNSYGE